MALSTNPVISVVVSWMRNNAKDVETRINNTLRISAPLRYTQHRHNPNFSVKLMDFMEAYSCNSRYSYAFVILTRTPRMDESDSDKFEKAQFVAVRSINWKENEKDAMARWRKE